MPCQSFEAACRWCLDKTGLSVPLVIIIVAFGSAVLVFVGILILVIREVRKHSGEVSFTLSSKRSVIRVLWCHGPAFVGPPSTSLCALPLKIYWSH